MNNQEDNTSMEQPSVYPTSPTLTPKYSYLASLDDWAVGLRRQQETALYVRANTDHDMEGPSPVALEPLPAAALERSLNPAGSNEAAAAPGGLLPEDLYAILKDRPYDPFWMEANGISGHIHPGNPSKVKLEKLFYDGCLLVGDKFRIRLVAHNGGAFIAEATVLSVGAGPRTVGSASSKHFPDFQVSASPDRPTETIWACKGTTYLAAALASHHGTLTPTTSAGGFKAFEVFRNIPGIGERHLGSLHDIRQVYQTWQDELEAWSIRNDQEVHS